MPNTTNCLNEQDLIELIYTAYKAKYKWVHKDIPIETATLTGQFSKNDADACKKCKELDIDKQTKVCNNDDEFVANYNTNNKVVHFINIEQVLKSISKRKSSVCDFMFYCDDMSKFVLNELTCSTSDFIFDEKDNGTLIKTGKRKKAQEQFKTVIDEFMDMPEIKSEIDKFQECIALFSYRIKGVIKSPKEDTDTAMKSMGGFIRSSISSTSLHSVEKIANKFIYEERIYPNAYIF